MSKLKDLTGQSFGRLDVVERVYPSSVNGKARWLCQCDCGSETVVIGRNLLSGKTASCGCMQRERVAECKTTHGMYGTRLYSIWHSMNNRCLNQNAKAWRYYGGRGVDVCEDWKAFEHFAAWAMETGYSDELTIDRVDNNRGYGPENCRWATVKEQARNQRSNRPVMCIESGLTYGSVAEAAESTGIPYDSIYRAATGLCKSAHKTHWVSIGGTACGAIAERRERHEADG